MKPSGTSPDGFLCIKNTLNMHLTIAIAPVLTYV